jgi:hypothetical protein
MDGTANNFLAGSLGIGATNLTGVNLFLSKTLTGSVDSYHINVNGIIQSDVTNSATYFRSSASTAAASFAVGSLFHYVANQGSLGAGSSVGTQTGFQVNANLIGATNNFGFRGDIPSGTNRWNLYMAGTAANYMAGQLLVGTTTHTDGSMFQSTFASSALNAYRQQTGDSGIIGFYSNQTTTKNVVAYIRCDGGLANYSANNLNLSDERTKNSIVPIESYWDKFKAIQIVKFKYNGQVHDDYNIGVIAQQVELVAPEFVSNEGWGIDENNKQDLKSIYESDLHHATIKVLQEAMIKIELLEQKVKQLENK